MRDRPQFSPIVLTQFGSRPHCGLTVRTIVALLIAIAPWSVSAQTTPDDRLKEVVSKLRACVRTYAPSARAAGIQNTGDAINLFIETCTPPISILGNLSAPPARPGMLTLNDFADIGGAAQLPGGFRRVVGEEWTAFVEETRAR
jgi:hypothetical protein